MDDQNQNPGGGQMPGGDQGGQVPPSGGGTPQDQGGQMPGGDQGGQQQPTWTPPTAPGSTPDDQTPGQGDDQGGGQQPPSGDQGQNQGGM